MNALLAFAVLLLGFAGIGLIWLHLAGARLIPADGFYALVIGWGVLTFLATAGAMVEIPLQVTLYGGLFIGWSAVIFYARRLRIQHLRYAITALVPIVPALMVAVSFSSVQSDEFSHWLPNALYLYVHDTLPTVAAPNQHTSKQGYPIAVPYITYATSVLQGVWDDRVPKALSLILGALFAIPLASALLKREQVPLWIVVTAALAVTILNPFFDPRIAITTYSDMPTAFCFAAFVFALWRQVTGTDSSEWSVRAGMVAFTLAQIRETNVVLLLSALAMFVLILPRFSRWRWQLVLCASPAVIATATWRLHLMIEHIQPDMAPRGFADWNWSAPLTVIKSLFLDRLSNNQLAGISVLVATFVIALLATRAWKRLAGKHDLLILVGAPIAAQMMLLAFSYIAVFSEDEVAAAASAWRYATHLGPLGLVALAALCPPAPDRILTDGRIATASTIAAAVVISGSLSGRYRLTCTYPHIRPTFDAMVTIFRTLPANAKVGIWNTGGNLYLDEAMLARTIATKNWTAPRPVISLSSDPTVDFMIDLRQAPSAVSLYRTAVMQPLSTITLNVPACPAQPFWLSGR